MKFRILALGLSILSTCVTYAGHSYTVQSTKEVFFGPWIMHGDFHHLEILKKSAIKELKEKCSGEDKKIRNQEKINFIEIRHNTMRSLKIKISDECYII